MRHALLVFTSIILVGLFIYNSLGYYFVNQAIRLIHKGQVFESLPDIPDDLLVSIQVSKNGNSTDLNFESSKEITYKGRKYDVKKVIDQGSYITYLCFQDIKEDLLIEKNREITGRLLDGKPYSKAANLILDNIIKIAIVPDHADNYNPFVIAIPETGGITIISNPDLSVPSQPPKFSAVIIS
jgi:hypothetical protein